MPSGLSIGVRVAGDWSMALNRYANGMAKTTMKGSSIRHDGAMIEVSEKLIERSPLEVPVQVLIDGPYGGSSVDLGDYETVLLFSGGSGITFTLGLLDDIVGRCVRKGRKNGEKTKRIEFSWCIRSFGEYRCSIFIQFLTPIP
jgi:ferric-chelate reductase